MSRERKILKGARRVFIHKIYRDTLTLGKKDSIRERKTFTNIGDAINHNKQLKNGN